MRTGVATGVGMLGCGTVGGGVARLLDERAAELAARAGGPLRLAAVAVRDLGKARGPGLGGARLTTSPEEVVRDPQVHVVVELMGGAEPARSLVLEALGAGKPVITANKLLLAHHGPELFARARAAGVDLAFEGAVGGGIPVVRTLRDALASDRVTRLSGILNGTSNYVLTRMQREGLAFDEVLREAQRLGYAEAEPSLDVDGHDAAHKLVVLAALAFGAELPPGDVPTAGLRALAPIDHAAAERFGYVVKPLAVAEALDAGSVAMRVGPTLVPRDGLLAGVGGVLNAVLVEGEALGPCLLSGPGAGAGPTAVSVVADLLDVVAATRSGAAGRLSAAVRTAPARVRDPGLAHAPFYLRFVVRDEPGVLGRITTALGRAGVSIRELFQRAQRPVGEAEPLVDVVMLTHAATRASVAAAVGELDGAAFAVEPARVLPVAL